MNLKYFWLLFLLALPSFGQQPQTQKAPSYAVNAAYVNGVAPGYAPTADKAGGPYLDLGPGTAYCGTTISQYPGGIYQLTVNTTSYVYLNVSSSCAPAVSTSPFTNTQLPIASVVVDSSGNITSITDVRTPFNSNTISGGYCPLTGCTFTGPVTGTTFTGTSFIGTTFTGTTGNFSTLTTSVAPVIDPSSPTYGAVCDGIHDDHAAFTAASLQASNYYAITGVQPIVLIPFGVNGNCLIQNQIVYYSGTHFKGSGGTIVNNTLGINTFTNSDKVDGNDHIWFDGVRIQMITDSSLVGIEYTAAGFPGAGGGQHTDFKVTNSDIQGAGYAIKVGVLNKNDGVSHTLSNVVITQNHLWCSLVGGTFDTHCRDGVNLGGDVVDFHIDGNTVENRDDAAWAVVSAGGNTSTFYGAYEPFMTPRHGTISNNVKTNGGTCLDFSGGTDVVAVGNTCVDYIPNPNSTPQVRFVYYQFPVLSNIRVDNGDFQINYGGGADTSTMKMDLGGLAVAGVYPVCNCSVNNSKLSGQVYLRGNGFFMKGNTFADNTLFITATENGNATNNIILQGNTWLGTRTFNMTPINGGLTNAYEIGDYYGGTVINQSLTPAQAGALSSQTISLCGQTYDGSTVQYNPGCFNDQVRFAFGASSTLNRLHSATTGFAGYKSSEQWDSFVIFNQQLLGTWPTIATGSSFGAGALFIGSNYTTTAGEVDFSNLYKTNSTSAFDAYQFYANRLSTDPQLLFSIRQNGTIIPLGLQFGAGTVVTSINGTDTHLLSSGTISGGAGTPLCLDSNGGSTTSGCFSGVFVGSLTTTASTSDNVTVTGATASSHCWISPTNASAATNIATTYISTKAANTITITHTATASMTYDIGCTAN